MRHVGGMDGLKEVDERTERQEWWGSEGLDKDGEAKGLGRQAMVENITF